MEYITLKMGEIIREMRKARGLTQDALAQAAGVSVQAVSKWETAQSLPDVALLPAIADFFETTVDALFGREGEKGQHNKEEAAGAPVDFPDDDVLRVVQYMGRQLMSARECVDGKAVRLALDKYEGGLAVEVQGDARIDGSVSGNLRAAGDAYVSGNINGAATAGGDIHCEGRVVTIQSDGPARGESTGSIEINVRDAVKKGLSGLDSVLSVFSFGSSGKNRRMEPFFKDELPEDEVLRVVQLQGRRILRVEESAGDRVIRLAVDHLEGPLNVEVYGSAAIRGNVGGNATAGDSMTCGDVGGQAVAGDSLTCGDVGGDAKAGDGIQCGNVGGDVRAGDGVRATGDIGGNVSAGDSVNCQSILGGVTRGDVRTARRKEEERSRAREEKNEGGMDFSGADFSHLPPEALSVVQVRNGRVLAVEECRGDRAVRLALDGAEATLYVQGDARIDGDVGGDVRAQGNVSCGDVDGDVSAGGDVSCGDVDGDVKAGASVNCGDVEGDVQAHDGPVNCGEVDGDVNAGGTVRCGDVGGDINTGGSVSCGDVNGDIHAGGPVYRG